MTAVEIEIVGEITEDLADIVCDQLADAAEAGQAVSLRLRSEGGDVRSTLRIARRVQSYPHPLIAWGVDQIASGAAMIWLAAARRDLEPSCKVSLHYSRYKSLHVPECTAETLRSLLGQLEQTDDWLACAITTATGMSDDSARQLLAAEAWLNRAACLKARLLYSEG